MAAGMVRQKGRIDVPQILVVSNPAGDAEQGAVMLRERIADADFESGHFKVQLLERLSWAVEDAHTAEQSPRSSGTRPARDRRVHDGRSSAGAHVRQG